VFANGDVSRSSTGTGPAGWFRRRCWLARTPSPRPDQRAGPQERNGSSAVTAGPTTSLRWARPCPFLRPQRQHPRARHRGLLEYRWPGVQGHPTRRNGQVRAAGKESAKKDLGAVARSYGTCTSLRSHGANDTQATKALLEADAYPGPSLVIAYSTLHCPRHWTCPSR